MLRYFVPIMAVVGLLSYGCKGPESTQARSVPHPPQPGGTEVLKVCTERPQSYTASVESQLKAVLPLLGKSDVEAEGTVKAFLSQQPRGTQRGEELNNYLFYICQMSNNGKWSEATTERLILGFINKWGSKEFEDTPRKPKLELYFRGVPQKELQNKFPLPLALEPTRTARLAFVVANVGNGAVLNPLYSVDVSPSNVSVDGLGGEVYMTKLHHNHYQSYTKPMQPVEITGNGYRFDVEVLVPDEKIDTIDLHFRIFGDNLPHEDLLLQFKVIHHKKPEGS